MHRGFYNGASEVYSSPKFIRRKTMIYDGHSRGGAISSVMIYRFGGRGIGYGTPKAFYKRVSINFVNVRNNLDPVVHVVPFFKTVGEVIKIKFAKNPHTKYGDNIDPEEIVEWK